MKKFYMFQIGYTSGIYGCNGEYFNLMVINGDKEQHFIFQGLYTHGYQLAEFLREKGYEKKEVYVPYSQLKRNDLKGWKIYLESELLNVLKSIN